MADVPDQISYGEVTGRFVSFRADGPDGGEVPDEVPLSGTVTLTPSVSLVRFPTLEPPRIAAISSVTAQVVSGELRAPTGAGGVFVIATDQPLGQPDTVQWKATFNLAGAVAQPGSVTFNVPAGGVVDLVTVLPATPAPGTVVVVSSEDRILAQEARDAALQSAQDALAAEGNAEQSASDAEQSATSAEASALAASQSATSALNAASRVLQGVGMPNGVVTADTGTLYVDTAATNGASVWRKASGTGSAGWVVLDGDTGYRDISADLAPGWTGAVRLRRTGFLCRLSVRDLVDAGSASFNLLTIPAGFTPGSLDAAAAAPLFSSAALSSSVGAFGPTGQSRAQLVRATQGVSGAIGSVTWLTTDPWPTALPGTPA